jgi:RNA polymerase sigma factor (TIGR02999 family)
LEPEAERDETTRILLEIGSARASDREARDRLFSSVYDELRRMAVDLMRRERPGHTLRPTALVHETYLRLVHPDRASWENRAHFFGIAARAMRQILVEHAREKAAQKRGGALTRITLDENLDQQPSRIHEILDLHSALERLSGMDERIGRVVELKIFGGLEMAELAHVLGVSKRTVEGDWTFARMWLGRELPRSPA